MSRYKLYCLLFLLFIKSANTFAQNPLIRSMYSAEPSARLGIMVDDKNVWSQYKTVDFGNKKMKTVYVKARSDKGEALQIHPDGLDGAVIAEVNVPKSAEWNLVSAPVSSFKAGIHNLFVTLKEQTDVAVNWVHF
jgi:hypothetical protein